MKLFSFAEMNPAQVIFLKEKRPVLVEDAVQVVQNLVGEYVPSEIYYADSVNMR